LFVSAELTMQKMRVWTLDFSTAASMIN